MIERRMDYLRPGDYCTLRDETPIAFLPWGAHEWHGRHNALGVDGLKAHSMCLAMADRIGGVVLPPVYLGHGTMQRHCQANTLEFPIELVEQTARHYFMQLRVDGFRVIVVVMGHYGRDHLTAIQRVARRVEEDFPGVLRIIAEPDAAWTEPQFPGDHGAANETSYMMLFHPQTVDLAALPSLADKPKLDFRGDGVGGPDPRTEASAERGRRQLDMLIDRATVQIAAALHQVRPDTRRRA